MPSHTDNINVGDTIYLCRPSGWSGRYVKKDIVTRKTPTGKITVGDIRFTENLREIGVQGWGNGWTVCTQAEYLEALADNALREKLCKIEQLAYKLTRARRLEPSEVKDIVAEINKIVGLL